MNTYEIMSYFFLAVMLVSMIIMIERANNDEVQYDIESRALWHNGLLVLIFVSALTSLILACLNKKKSGGIKTADILSIIISSLGLLIFAYTIYNKTTIYIKIFNSMIILLALVQLLVIDK